MTLSSGLLLIVNVFWQEDKGTFMCQAIVVFLFWCLSWKGETEIHFSKDKMYSCDFSFQRKNLRQ